MMGGGKQMRAVEGGAAAVALLACLLSWLLAPSAWFSLGVAAGALLTLLDFVLLRLALSRFLARREGGVARWLLLLLGKWAFLGLLLYVAVKTLNLDAMGLIVGVSVIVFSFVTLPALLGPSEGDAERSSATAP